MQYPSRSPVTVAAHHWLLPTNMPGISGARRLVRPSAVGMHPAAEHPPSTTQSISPGIWTRPPYANSAACAIISPAAGRHMPSRTCQSVLLGSNPADAASAVWAPPGYPPPATISARGALEESTILMLLLPAQVVILGPAAEAADAPPLALALATFAFAAEPPAALTQ
eukprot:scaffold60996_cov84-Phaeocystis_antarctica.AAC.5